MQTKDAVRLANSRAGTDPDKRSVAYLAFAKAATEIDPSKGKASAYFYQAINHALTDHFRKESKHAGNALFLDEITPANTPSPEKEARYGQFLSKLSRDALQVLRLLYGGNESKNALVRALRAENWTHKRISLTFAEIRETMEVTL